jgi:hypothetical protein
MRSLVLLLCLLPVTVSAQEPEPQYTIRISIHKPDGLREFSREIVLPASLMPSLIVAAEVETAKQNLGTPNPDYDAAQPISESNQPVLPLTGNQAVFAFTKWFFTEIIKAHAGTAEAQQVLKTKKTETREKLDQVKTRDSATR